MDVYQDPFSQQFGFFPIKKLSRIMQNITNFKAMSALIYVTILPGYSFWSLVGFFHSYDFPL